jgi:hypothetical protein
MTLVRFLCQAGAGPGQTQAPSTKAENDSTIDKDSVVK